MVRDEDIGDGPYGLVPIGTPGIDLTHSSNGYRRQRNRAEADFPFRKTHPL